MSYTWLALAAVVFALALDLFVLRTRLVRRRVFWVAYLIIFVFQLISNGVLTYRHVVRYDHAAILGLRIAGAPVEDIAFGFSLVLQTLCWWAWWGRRVTSRGYRARAARQKAGPATASRRASGPDTRRSSTW
jgi:lycopene cyclase domain-containing protein